MSSIRSTSFVLILIWTAVLAGLLEWNVIQEKHALKTGALQSGRNYFSFLVLGRAWNALHGGVYLKASESIQPNQYLPAEQRELDTVSGEQLVKVNPAFMTRLLSEMAETRDGVRFHITSLNPVRPENGPDAWESEALRAFEQGSKEFFLWEQSPAFRYMAPLVVTEACMPCHAQHGYTVGDVRGGISIDIPAGRAREVTRQGIRNLYWAFFMTWGLGALGILFGMRRIEGEVRRADAANLSKSEFLATMSHEIRNSLNGVLGMVHLVQTTNLDAEQKEYIGAADASGKVLLSIVNDVVDFSRIEAGRLEIVPQSFNPHTLLKEVLVPHQIAAHGKSVKLIGEIDPGVPDYVFCDPVRLRQILNNLCGNAVKFTDCGEVRVRLCLLEGSRLQGEVRDTGPGISPEQVKRLFRPYEQVCPDAARASRGSGLGLSIVRRLTDLMQGDVEMESVEGVGTVVRFSVAVSIPDQGAEVSVKRASEEDSGGAVGERLNILVAEDDVVNRLVMTRLLQKRGHEVVCVENGKKAVDVVFAGGIDLVFMDIGMPVMDGVQATGILRGAEDSRTSSIPIIGLSANAMAGDRDRFLAAGMDEYLTKPIDVDKLLNIVAGYRSQKDMPTSA